VLEVFEIAESAIRPAPDVGDVAARAANTVVSYRGGMAFILNMQAVAKLAEVALKESESA
jgi:chemotaxis signal transduction protein